VRGSGYTANLSSVPPSGETIQQTPKSFRGARTRLRFSITLPSLVGLGFHPAPGWPKTLSLLPAALRAAQTCRYLIYSEADFEAFRPAGATRCTDRGEIWLLLHAKFHPHRCNDKGVGLPKLKFLLRFDRNVVFKGPTGAYPLRDFHTICRLCTPFQRALSVKILLDLLEGLWSYGGFKLRGPGCPQIFSAP